MLTSKEFAKLLGVSQSTISRAMNDSDLVPAEKKKMIRQKAVEYGFVLNSQARSLKTNRTGTIGIIFPRHFVGMGINLMMAHLFDLIQKELDRYSYDIMPINDSDSSTGISVLERIIRCRKVDGVILMRAGGLLPREKQLLTEHKIPCVCMMHVVQNADFLSYFISDSAYAGRMAGEYMGAFRDYMPYYLSLDIQEEQNEVKIRLDALRQGLAVWNRELPDDHILACNLSTKDAYQYIVDHAALFKGQKAFLLTHCDVLALGVLDALEQLQIPVPHQTQLLSWDDIPLSSATKPGLSVIHISAEKMVTEGCHELREMIEGGEERHTHMLFPPKLIIRDTSLPLPGICEQQIG